MTELTWDGKYKDGKKVAPVRIALPFQTIETVNESAQDRQRTLDLFASGRETEWRNRLIWGDKKYVLPSLLPEFSGKINVIYIDPPFDTGADFSFTTTIPDIPGTAEDETVTFVKEPSILEQKAYRDTWGRGLDSYLQWFYETAVFLYELLAEDGSIYVHLDWHVGHYAKAVLDEVFGIGNFRNEIIWKRTSGHSDATRYGSSHDTIFFYVKCPSATWNDPYQPYDKDYVENYYRYSDPDGRRWMSGDLGAAGLQGGGYDYVWKGVRRIWRLPQSSMEKLDKEGKLYYTKTGIPRIKRYLDESKGMPTQDIWSDVESLRSWHKERLDYGTQKPEALLERIIKASSNEEELILDCFVGSGTTAAVAEKLGRRWIACDLGRFSIHTTRKRLLGIEKVRPFIVQNLGKYERQAWQAAEFSSPEDLREREIRYRKFILDLYRAEPIAGYAWLHGVRNGRMVHVGTVDAPVTLPDVKSIAAEVWRAVGTGKSAPRSAGVDILGWEFAFELNELAKQVAAEAKVDVAFKKIPREVLEKKAVEQGDIKFFELAALSVNVKQKGLTVTLKLTDFVVPPDDVPEEARSAIKHWSQWIDYWAVDWDYKDDTFHNQWQSYRTRKETDLQKETSYTYECPGAYTIVVKVIDILGNDTTKTLQIKVK